MKPINSFFFFLLVLLLPAGFLMPLAHAQSGSWLWGRGAISSGPGFGCDAWPVATDGLGDVYAAGFNFENSTIAFGTTTLPSTTTAGTCDGSGFIQVVWAKYNSTGVLQWADGTQNGDAWIFNIASDPGNNLIVFGAFDSPTLTIDGTTLTNAYGAAGTTQYFIAKFNPSGTLLWAINDGNAFNSGHGISSSVVILGTGGVSTDAAGNIYVTGNFQLPSITIGTTTLTNADPSGNTSDVFVAKYNSSGTLVWASRFGGSSDDFAYGITAVPSGNVYITGPFWSPSVSAGTSVIANPYATGGYFAFGSDNLAYIAEFSPTGAPLWAEAAGGANGAYGVGLTSDAAGNVYMTGGFGDASISFGSVTLNRTYPAAVPQLALFLVQFSPSNVVTWSKTIGSATDGVWGFGIGLAACGEVWVSGNFNSDANIDGHTLFSPLDTMATADPVFIAGYNLAGGVIGYSALASGGDDQNGISVDPNGNVFICSDYEDDVNFTIGPDQIYTATATFFSGEYFYVGKYANLVGVPDTNTASHDTTVCSSVSSITLLGPNGYTSYDWNTAATTSSIVVTGSGTYYVICSSTCSIPTFVDTFHVSITPAGTSFDDTDIVVCNTLTAVNINGNAGYSSYAWNTGSSAANISVTDTGTYWVVETSGCGTRSDTFHISLAPTVTSFNDTALAICNPAAGVNISGNTGYTSYAWNTGSSAANISITDTGTYWVVETNNCNVRTDTFNISLAPPIPVTASNAIQGCNAIITFNVVPAGAVYSYAWAGPAGFTSNTQDPIITNVSLADQGVYTVTVMNTANGCSGQATTSVTVPTTPPPTLTNITPTQTIDYGSSVQLNVDNSLYYWWLPDDGSLSNRNINNPVATPLQTTTYTVYGMDSAGCIDSAKIIVDVIFDSVLIPSAFTPNGDGLNDIFRPIGMKYQSLIEFSVYNRWGQQIFTTANKDQGWDGTFNGVKQDMDVYNYVIIVGLDDGNTRFFKGNVTLIR